MANMLSEPDLRLLTELKDILTHKYGALIDQFYCYGSRVYAQRQDSDFDLLIITNRKVSWQEEHLIYKDIFIFGLEKDVLFDARFFTSNEVYQTDKEMPFLKNIFSYGISV